MNRGRRAAIVGALLLVPGSLLVARAGWIEAKGAAGELLIRRALSATLRDGHERRPWPWADMHPVARLSVPRLDIVRPILSNASGAALAFGIGHVSGTADPGGHGNSVLAGHRDSWAAFLAELEPDDVVEIEARSGRSAFRVASTEVVRFDAGGVLAPSATDRLTLVTCWPFDGWLHSPWRFVVRCERIAGANPRP